MDCLIDFPGKKGVTEHMFRLSTINEEINFVTDFVEDVKEERGLETVSEPGHKRGSSSRVVMEWDTGVVLMTSRQVLLRDFGTHKRAKLSKSVIVDAISFPGFCEGQIEIPNGQIDGVFQVGGRNSDGEYLGVCFLSDVCKHMV